MFHLSPRRQHRIAFRKVSTEIKYEGIVSQQSLFLRFMQSKVTSISPETLSLWILSGKHDFLLVDVRDVDYLHERIKGAMHAPSSLLAISLSKVADYISSLETQPFYTIFYCNEWCAFFLCLLTFFPLQY